MYEEGQAKERVLLHKELDMKTIIRMMKKRWKLFVIIISLFVFIGSLMNYIIAPRYEAKTDILVNYTKEDRKRETLETSDIAMSLQLIETYKYMLKSDRLVSKVNDKLNHPYSQESLKKYISIESGSNSQIISIIAREKTPEKAALLVNTYAAIFQEEVKTLMNLENITILNEVSETTGVQEVKLPYFIVIGVTFIIGLMISLLFIFIQVFYSDKLNTVFKVERLLWYPNLGVIPVMKSKKHRQKKLPLSDQWPAATVKLPATLQEAFRRIRTNIQFQMTQKNVQTMLVTSSTVGEGKSLVSGRLAISMAMSGKRTLYMDGNLRKSVGRRIFDLPAQKGLTSIIAGTFQLKDVIQTTTTENLFFMSTGPMPPNPTEILSSKKMVQLIEQLKDQYEVIIIDTPALEVADAASLSAVVDGCLYVIDAARTKEAEARESLAQLQKVDAPILGTILNKSYA